MKKKEPLCWCVGVVDKKGNPEPIGSMKIERTEESAQRLADELNSAMASYGSARPFVAMACYITRVKKNAQNVKRKTRKGKK